MPGRWCSSGSWPQEKALCDIGFFVGASETNAAEAAGLAREAAGLKIYLDQTYGPLRMRGLAALLAHYRTWPADRPIAVHAEGLSAAMAIGLARSLWPAAAPVPHQPGGRDRADPGSQGVGGGRDL